MRKILILMMMLFATAFATELKTIKPIGYEEGLIWDKNQDNKSKMEKVKATSKGVKNKLFVIRGNRAIQSEPMISKYDKRFKVGWQRKSNS